MNGAVDTELQEDGPVRTTSYQIYRGLDLLTTLVIRCCLLVVTFIWLDRDLAEVTLILWTRLWGLEIGLYSYLLLFLGGFHWEFSRMLGDSNVDESRKSWAISFSLLSCLGLVLYLNLLPESAHLVPGGLLLGLLISMTVTAPALLLRHWEPSQKGRLSFTRLALLGVSTGAVVGWIHLLSPWVRSS